MGLPAGQGFSAAASAAQSPVGFRPLARTAANLNQIAHRLNAGDALPLAEVRATLDAFRRDLIGVKHDSEDVEDESEG